MENKLKKYMPEELVGAFKKTPITLVNGLELNPDGTYTNGHDTFELNGNRLTRVISETEKLQAVNDQNKRKETVKATSLARDEALIDELKKQGIIK